MKAARGKPGGRDAMRMMQKMGMKVDEVANVSQVIIRTDSRNIVIEEPSVTMVTVQGQAMYQIAGGRISEEALALAPQLPSTTSPSDADVQLVAQQTGKSTEESRIALAQAGGDLAKAILTLKGQTTTPSN
jgi:nascent polypeptide-associated complex subunit alpha